MNLMNVSLVNLPQAQRWRAQLYPAPIVVALIQRPFPNNTSRYLLIKRKSSTHNGQWALVGGKWDFGEAMATAVTREVGEETGLQAQFIGLRGIVSERIAPVDNEGMGAHFLLFVCALTAPNGEAHEHNEGEVGWFTLTEMDALHREQAIIPSDFALINRFAGETAVLPHIEIEMLGGVGKRQQPPAQLMRFEEIKRIVGEG